MAPSCYAVLHVHRESDQGGPNRGNGLAVIHRDSLVVSNYALQKQSKPTTFELELVHIRTGASSLIFAKIYQPPSQFVNPVFFDEMADLLTNILATTSKSLLLTCDFNCLDKDSNNIDTRLTTVLELFGIVQTVSGATCSNNLLEILAFRTSAS